ncbi:MAG: YiaA/YiaB family inner membrane protein [Sandaracinaceae bacterium]
MKRNSNTPAWRFQSWAAFVISAGLTGFGVMFLPVDIWMRGFLGMGLLFTIGSCFSLAKTIRDDAEATRDPRSEPSSTTSHGPFRTPA